jgi:ABC-2 type transport system ATP-binding protein
MGITIIYTTHDMEEADKLCERIAIMDRGKLIALGTSEQLKTHKGKHYPSLEDVFIAMTKKDLRD